MAYVPNEADARLRVEFYTREITKGRNPRTEEWVRVFNPADTRNEYHAKADSVALVRDGEDVTYAERFPQHYAAFKAGKTKNAAQRVEELRAQLAIAEREVTAPAAKGDKASEQDISEMSDDELRAFIEETGGKPVPANVSKRETLERMAAEVREG